MVKTYENTFIFALKPAGRFGLMMVIFLPIIQVSMMYDKTQM